MLFLSVMTNRVSQVFRYETVRWYCIIPDSLSATLVIALLMFKQINITYKKWYCTFFGFTAYLSIGAFQMSVLGFPDAYHIAEPILSGTPLTAWVMAPLYAVGYGLVLLVIELVRKHCMKAKSHK